MLDASMLPLVAVLVLAAAGFPLSIAHGRAKVRRWDEMGAGMGLRPAGELAKGGMVARALVGQRGRFPVQVRTFVTRGKDKQSTWTAVEVAVPEADTGFTMGVHRMGLSGRINVALGAVDLEVGDPVFDAAHRVESNDPARARGVLGATTRAALAALPLEGSVGVERGVRGPDSVVRRAGGDDRGIPSPFHPKEVVDGPPVLLVRWVRQGHVRDGEALRVTLDTMVRLAEAVAAVAEAPPRA